MVFDVRRGHFLPSSNILSIDDKAPIPMKAVIGSKAPEITRFYPLPVTTCPDSSTPPPIGHHRPPAPTPLPQCPTVTPPTAATFKPQEPSKLSNDLYAHTTDPKCPLSNAPTHVYILLIVDFSFILSCSSVLTSRSWCRPPHWGLGCETNYYRTTSKPAHQYRSHQAASH